MNILDDFEAMRGLSGGMLESARANDWERLIRLEHELADRRDALAAGRTALPGSHPTSASAWTPSSAGCRRMTARSARSSSPTSTASAPCSRGVRASAT